MNRLNKNMIITLLLISLSALISILYIKNQSKNKEYTVITLPVSTCNAQKKICRVDTDNFSIEILFDKNIYYLKPFSVSVWADKNGDFSVESISIDFKMKDMEMGINRFKLSKEANPGRNKQAWKGRALLPACVTGRADWLSELEIATKQKKYLISFPILVEQAAN